MDEPTPQHRRGRRWNYEQKLPGESPELALERAVEKFETYVGLILKDFDRPVKIRAQIEVVELPPTTATDPTTDATDDGHDSEAFSDA